MTINRCRCSIDRTPCPVDHREDETLRYPGGSYSRYDSPSRFTTEDFNNEAPFRTGSSSLTRPATHLTPRQPWAYGAADEHDRSSYMLRPAFNSSLDPRYHGSSNHSPRSSINISYAGSAPHRASNSSRRNEYEDARPSRARRQLGNDNATESSSSSRRTPSSASSSNSDAEAAVWHIGVTPDDNSTGLRYAARSDRIGRPSPRPRGGLSTQLFERDRPQYQDDEVQTHRTSAPRPPPRPRSPGNGRWPLGAPESARHSAFARPPPPPPPQPRPRSPGFGRRPREPRDLDSYDSSSASTYWLASQPRSPGHG